ncbi:hypothetical protein BH10ACI3_BH10ACI3_12780 [soil metagenome]
MSKMSFIDGVKVSSPCTEDWEKMHGNDRIRFCDHCVTEVKDLSAITRKEAMRIVRAADGNICIRYAKDAATNRMLFADQLINITRRSPGIAAGVMTASIALSTAAYAQEVSNGPAPVTASSTVRPVAPVAVGTPPAGSVTQQPIIDLPVESRVVTMGMMVAMPSERYTNALTIAVSNDDVDQVRDLISKGSDVNGREGSKLTPLFVAVESGNVEMARLLLEYGAKVNARDKNKQTPLMQLDADATPELVDLLLTHGAKVNLTDNEGNTALILAAGIVSSEVLQKLVVAAADINLVNKEKQTALMNAADNDNVENVRILLVAGAKVNLKNSDGDTAWDLTTEKEVEDLLVSYGAEISETENDSDGETVPDN